MVKKKKDFRSRKPLHAIEWKAFHSKVAASFPGMHVLAAFGIQWKATIAVL